MYLTSLSLKKTPRMFWGFFRIRKDRHLLRVVHPTAREKKKTPPVEAMYGLTSQRGFLTTFATRFETFCWLGSSLKKGNKVVRKSWEIRKFLLHNSQKTQPKKNNTMFCLDPLLIGGEFKFRRETTNPKTHGRFCCECRAMKLFLDIFRHIVSHCFGGAMSGGHLGCGLGVTLVQVGYSPEVQQEVRPLKRYLLNRN